MNQMISVLIFVLALFCTAFFGHMIYDMAGFRKSNLLYVTGFLERTEGRKNVFRGHPFSGKWIKHWTICTYTYCVNGQKYHRTCGIAKERNAVPRKVTVAVWKTAPKKGIVPQFERMPSWGLLMWLFIGCIVLYAAAVALWTL